jgi:hypothetical protein
MADMICHKVYELLMSILNISKIIGGIIPQYAIILFKSETVNRPIVKNAINQMSMHVHIRSYLLGSI